MFKLNNIKFIFPGEVIVNFILLSRGLRRGDGNSSTWILKFNSKLSNMSHDFEIKL